MTKTMSVRLPEYLHREIKALAEREGVSMNQFIATAVAEKMSSLKTVDYLQQRAKRGDRAAFNRVLDSVQDVKPQEDDEL